MDVIKTDGGYVSGTVLGELRKRVHVYRGIPYAAPPVGDLRWKPPQPVVPWSGIRECTAFSLIAPQSRATPTSVTGGMPQSEDCLYLNVTSPARKVSDKLPVMVWMHPGGIVFGSANAKLNNGIRLPLQGVVLVTANMRLGAIGCLAHPLLSRESPEGASGNYLFLDMVAALRWVQKNISAFGGDPDNVTIFGQSGGSYKVIVLMASPLAKGLFQRAIGESGGRMTDSSSLATPLKEMESTGEKVFARLGVNKERDPLAAARALPWEKIVEAGNAVAADMNTTMGPWNSVVDGWFLPDAPANIFKTGKQNVVPFIIGSTLGELTGPGPLVKPEWIPDYVNLLKGARRVGGKGYAYIFGHVPAAWKKDGAVAAHNMDVLYVFGDWDNKSGFWPDMYNFVKPSGAKTVDPGLTEADKQVSERMMKIWTQFAKTGNPDMKGLVDWPAWNEVADPYLYVTESLEVKSGFSRVAQK